MKFIKMFVALIGVTSFMGCAAIDCKSGKESTAYALPGTNTAVIGVSVDTTGLPQVKHKEIIIYPGQKVLYAGPDEFAVFFKDKKTPNRKIENLSSKGVVIVQIPKDILEQKEFAEEFRKTGEIKFSYGVRVGNKELDPMIIVKRKD